MANTFQKLTIAIAIATLAACGGDSTETHISNAKAYLAESDYDAAVIELKNALQIERNSEEARWLLGKAYLDIGDAASSQKELEQALRLGWASDDIIPSLALALLAQDEYVKIRELSKDGLSTNSQAQLMAVQAMAESAQGESGRSQMLIDRAIELAPEQPQVLLAKSRLLLVAQKNDEAMDVLNKLLAIKSDYPQAWLLKGDIHSINNETDMAIDAYNMAIAEAPEFYTALERRAVQHLQNNDYEKAQQDASTLLSLSSVAPGGNYIQGIINFHAGDNAAAVETLTLAEPAFRQYPLTLFYLANAHLQEGHSDHAREFAERFLAIAPGSVAGRKLLATMKLSAGDYQEVQEILQPVLDNYPEDVDALNLMSNALIRSGQSDKGLEMLAKAAELQPDNPLAQVRLGAGMLLSGDGSEDVTATIESALELDPQFQQADILLVLNHLKNGDSEKAVEAANNFINRAPDSVTPYNLLGRVYLTMGDSEQATDAFNKALKLEPTDPGANHSLAELAIKNGDTDTAREHYDTVLTEHKDLLQTLIYKAQLEYALGNIEETQKILQTAMDAHPMAVEPRLIVARIYLQQKNPGQVPALFASLDPTQQQSPAVMLVLAASYLDAAQYEQATRLLDQLVEKSDPSAALHHQLGKALAGSGDNRRSREELERSLEIDPEYLPSLMTMARMNLSANDTAAYEASMARLMEVAPEHTETLQIAALAAYRSGNLEGAIELATKAFEAAPSEASLLRLMGYMEIAGQYDKSIAMQQEWLRTYPNSVAVELALGISLGKSGAKSESLEYYRRVLLKQPTNFIALNNLAWELRESDTKEALGYAKRAVAAQPRSAEALDTLAVIEFNAKDYSAAQQSIRRALEEAPKAPSLIYHAAMIDAASGDKLMARQALDTLLKSGQDFPEKAEAQDLWNSLQ
jgi:putative PEP-CTERM system TPR-repeat lipoprotein